MRETYQPPTTSPAGPPHDHTHPRHSCTHTRHDHPRLRHSHTQPRHSRVGGNLHLPASTPPKRRHSSRRLQNSTKPDRTLRDSTETRARTRARQQSSVSFLSAWIVPRSQRIRRTAWSCRPIAAMPINQTEPGFVLRTCDVKRGKGDMDNLHGGHLLYYPGYGTMRKFVPSTHISPLRIDGLGAWREQGGLT